MCQHCACHHPPRLHSTPLIFIDFRFTSIRHALTNQQLFPLSSLSFVLPFLHGSRYTLSFTSFFTFVSFYNDFIYLSIYSFYYTLLPLIPRVYFVQFSRNNTLLLHLHTLQSPPHHIIISLKSFLSFSLPLPLPNHTTTTGTLEYN